MIAKLKGLIDTLGDGWVVIDVGGVGYLVFCSARTLRALPAVGEAAALHIETHVREDHIHLYGFAEPGERDWFRLLLGVQGVGARVALALLSVLGPDELTGAIAAGDRTALSQASGVGGKLAGRIASELKDKVASLALPGTAAPASGGADAGKSGGLTADALSALVNLGYRPAEAMTAIAAAQQALGGEATVETVIHDALKELSR
jgi:Holliday junction DNA helicase RuvA